MSWVHRNEWHTIEKGMCTKRRVHIFPCFFIGFSWPGSQIGETSGCLFGSTLMLAAHREHHRHTGTLLKDITRSRVKSDTQYNYTIQWYYTQPRQQGGDIRARMRPYCLMWWLYRWRVWVLGLRGKDVDHVTMKRRSLYIFLFGGDYDYIKFIRLHDQTQTDFDNYVAYYGSGRNRYRTFLNVSVSSRSKMPAFMFLVFLNNVCLMWCCLLFRDIWITFRPGLTLTLSMICAATSSVTAVQKTVKLEYMTLTHDPVPPIGGTCSLLRGALSPSSLPSPPSPPFQ